MMGLAGGRKSWNGSVVVYITSKGSKSVNKKVCKRSEFA